MVSTYTANKRIEQPAFNDYVDTWDVPVNNDWAIIDLALGGSVSINTTGLSGNVTLVTAQYQPLKIVFTGTPTAAINYRVPSAVGGLWVARNDTVGGFAVTMDSLAGGAAVTIPAAQNTLVTCDGTATGMFLAINTSPVAAGSTTQIQYNNAGVLAGSANLVFNGTTVTTTGLSVTGTTVLGDAVGDAITVNAGTMAIPNGVNIGSNNLYLSGTKVGIGTATLGAELLTVAGVIYTTAGGIKFPDNTTQTTASVGTVPGGSTTQVQFNDAGAFGGDAGLVFNKTTNALTTTGLLTAAGATLSSTLTMTGAAINGTKAAVASASTTAIGAAPANNIDITGTTTINAFDSIAFGATRIVYFGGSLTLVQSGVLGLPNGGNNIQTQAGDTAILVSSGGGTWVCYAYQRASGAPVALNPAYITMKAIGAFPFSFSYTPRLSTSILTIEVDIPYLIGQNTSSTLTATVDASTLNTATFYFTNNAQHGGPFRVIGAYQNVSTAALTIGSVLTLNAATLGAGTVYMRVTESDGAIS
jgi:hypothetical protein